MKGQCEVNGCQQPAQYGIFKTFSNDGKRWLQVCEHHEFEIGNENMRRAGGYLYKNSIKAKR